MPEQTLRLGIDPGPAKRGARQYDRAIDRHVRRPSQQAARAVGGTESSFHRLKGASGLLRGALATIGIGSVALAFRQAVGAAIEFEQAMTGVAKTVDAPTAVLAQMGEDIKALSERIPVAATEIAGVAEAAGQLGIQTDNIMAFTEVMVALGVSTNLSANEAATALARLANIMQTPQDQFDRMGATVVDLGNNLATTEAEIVSFATRMAGAAEIAGLTEANVLAVGGALSSVGVEAEAGGTAVQKVLLGINDAVARGNEDLEQFARTAGMSAEEFATLWDTDAASAFTSFVEGLGRAGDDATVVLEDLGLNNQRLVRSFLSLANAGDLLRESVDLGTKAWEENTALTEEASKFYDTLGSDLKELGNLAKNVAGEFGAMFAEDIRAGGDEFARSLGAIRENMDLIGRTIRAVVTPVAGLVRLAFNVGQAIGNLLDAVVAQIGAFVTETVNMAIRSINWLITQANRIRGVDIGTLGLLDSSVFIDETSRALGDFLGNSQDMLDTFEDIGNSVLSLFNPAVENASEAMSGASDSASGLAGQVDDVTASTDAAAASANNLAAAYRTAFRAQNQFSPVPDVGIGGSGSTFSQYGGAATATPGGGPPKDAGGSFLSGVLDDIRGGFMSLLDNLASGVGNILGRVASAFNPLTIIATVFNEALREAARAAKPLVDALAPLVRIIGDAFRPAFEALAPVIEKLQPVINAVATGFAGIIIALTPILEALVPILELVVRAFSYLLSAIGYVVKGLGWLIDKLIGWFTDWGERLEDFGQGLIDAGAATREALDNGTQGVDSFTNAVNAATRVLNPPGGFKVDLARFNATEGATSGPGGGGGGGGGLGGPRKPRAPVRDITINVTQRDGEDSVAFARRVVRALEDARSVGDAAATNMTLSPAGV